MEADERTAVRASARARALSRLCSTKVDETESFSLIERGRSMWMGVRVSDTRWQRWPTMLSTFSWIAVIYAPRMHAISRRTATMNSEVSSAIGSNNKQTASQCEQLQGIHNRRTSAFGDYGQLAATSAQRVLLIREPASRPKGCA